jgi:cytochrome b561
MLEERRRSAISGSKDRGTAVIRAIRPNLFESAMSLTETLANRMQKIMSNIENSFGRYGNTAIFLHWVAAILFVALATVGLLFDSMSKSTQPFWINIHAVAGLLFFALIVARLLWRIRHKPPVLPATVDAFSRKIAHPVHMLMYTLMLSIPMLGVIAFVWHGRAFNFGAFAIDFGVKSNKSIFHPAEDYHAILVYALIGLASLHALAALWHHFIRKDGVLKRMVPIK